MDGCSGTVVMNIGHNNSDVNNAIKSQIEKLIHFYDFASETRIKFLKKLKSTLFNGCDVFHINNSGAEAVESAIRMIRSSTGRFEIISFENSYHGRTLGALSLTSGSPKKGIGPLLPGVYHSKKNFNYCLIQILMRLKIVMMLLRNVLRIIRFPLINFIILIC